VDTSTVDDLLDRFPVLIIFDGLDEVAQRQTRQRVVTEIERFIGRWRGSAVPPKSSSRPDQTSRICLSQARSGSRP
jgi:predicted NACHT family NTPase